MSSLIIYRLFFTTFLPVLILTSILISCSEEVEVYHAKKKELIEAVYASGVSKAENNYKVIATVNGIIEKIHKQEGDSINTGEVLFTIRKIREDQELNKAKEALNIANENLSKNSPLINDIDTKIQNLKSIVHKDSLDFQRNTRLYNNKAISKDQLEKINLKYTNSKSNLESLILNKKDLLNKLNSNLVTAQQNYNIILKSAKEYQIKSEINGYFLQKNKNLGEFIRVGEFIAQIGDLSNILFDLKVDELDKSKLKLNQKIKLSIDATNNKYYDATITKIHPNINQADQTFLIEASLTNPSLSSEISPGMTTEANIIINQKQNILVLENQFIIDNQKVWTIENDKEKLIPIKIGLQNNSESEIISGIDENTSIILKSE